MGTEVLHNPDFKTANSIYDFSAVDIKGNVVSLEKYRGHVCMIVNIASQCGYTKENYEELNELYEKHGKGKGLKILVFPCNQFSQEESENNEEIGEFADNKHVKFALFQKVNVNGYDAHPLWKYLKHEQGGALGDSIQWNFTKFIIDRNGHPVERHGPNTDPNYLVKNLERYW